MPALTSGLSSSQGRDTGGRHSPRSRIAEPMPGISAIRWMRRLPAICVLVAVGQTLEKPPAQETGIQRIRSLRVVETRRPGQLASGHLRAEDFLQC